MKRFTFPLRPVAVLRAHRELRAREALGAAIQAATVAEDRASAASVRVRDLALAICGRRRAAAAVRDEIALTQSYRRECAAELEAHKQLTAARTLVELHDELAVGRLVECG